MNDCNTLFQNVTGKHNNDNIVYGRFFSYYYWVSWGWLGTEELLQAKSSKSRCRQGHTPSAGFLAYASIWRLPGVLTTPQLVNTLLSLRLCVHRTIFLLCGLSSSSKDTSCCIQISSRSYLMTSAKTSLTNKVMCWVFAKIWIYCYNHFRVLWPEMKPKIQLQHRTNKHFNKPRIQIKTSNEEPKGLLGKKTKPPRLHPRFIHFLAIVSSDALEWLPQSRTLRILCKQCPQDFELLL